MAAVPRRAERLRRLARQLSEEFALPPDAIAARIDDYAVPKVWRLYWCDGPTEPQLQRAAEKLVPR